MVGFIFEHMSRLLPVDRLCETENLVAFKHPQPIYPVHIVIVPRKALVSLTDLGERDTALLIDLTSCIKSLIAENNLEEAGYRVIVNGGKYQDVQQLHFHLVSGDQFAR